MNKKIKRMFVLILILITTLSACKKKDDLNTDIKKIDNTEKSLLKAEKLIEEKDLLAAEKAYENLLTLFDKEVVVYENLAYIKNYYGNKEEAIEILIKGIVNAKGDKEKLYLSLIDNIDSELYEKRYKKFFLDIEKENMTDEIFNNLIILNKENKELIKELKESYKPKNDEFLVFMENKINNYEDEELEKVTIDNINKDTDILLLEELIRDRVLIGYGYYEDLVLAKEILEKVEENNIDIDKSFLKGLKYYFDNHDGEKIEKIYFEDLDFDMEKDLVLVTSKDKYLYESGGEITILFSNKDKKVIDIEDTKATEIELLFSDLDKDAYKEIVSCKYYAGSKIENNLKLYSINDKEYNVEEILEENIEVTLEDGFVLDVVDEKNNEFSRLTLPKEVIDNQINKGIYTESGKLVKDGLLSISSKVEKLYDEKLKKETINIIDYINLDENLAYIVKSYELKEDILIYNGFNLFDEKAILIPKQDLDLRETEDIIEDESEEEEKENNLDEDEKKIVKENLNKLRKYFGKTSDEIIKVMGKPDRELLEDLHLGYAKYLVYIDEDNQEKYFTFNTDSDKLVGLDGDQVFMYGVDKYLSLKDIEDIFGDDYIKEDNFLSGPIDLDGNELDEIIYTHHDGLILTFQESAFNTNEYRLSLFLNSDE